METNTCRERLAVYCKGVGVAVGIVAVGGVAAGYYAYGGVALGKYVVGALQRTPEAMDFFKPWMPWLR